MADAIPLTVARLLEILGRCDPEALVSVKGTGLLIDVREEIRAPSAGQYLATVWLSATPRKD